MGNLKRIILAAIAALALTGLLGVSPASATTLEVTGVTKNESVEFKFSLNSGTSSVIRDTFGFLIATCTSSHMAGKTEANFTTKPTGNLNTLTLAHCSVIVDKPGKLYIEWTSGTNGKVFSENALITVWSELHQTYVDCETGAGTPIGTLTGVAAGNATLDINATVTCSPHLHSAKWTGTYTAAYPSGLGVSP